MNEEYLQTLKKILSDNSEIVGECIEWTGTLARGYGNFWYKKHWSAHRASYFSHHGAIPEGLYICHKCDNPKCIKIDHLYAGSAKDNARDRKNSKGFSKTIEKMKKTRKKNKEKPFVNNGYYRVKEFSELLDLHRNTVYQLISSGHINAFRAGRGKRSSFRIPVSEIERMALFNLKDYLNNFLSKE